MAEHKQTESQIVYERIEELKAGGGSLADAVRAVAAEREKTENAVRQNYYNASKKLNGARNTPRGRRRVAEPITAESAVSQAKALLEEALAGIDREVEAAKAEVDAAQVRYDELVASVAQRKNDLEAKITALS